MGSHTLTVNSGEDISQKIIQFSLQTPQAICILAAVGELSSATLRQIDSIGAGTTYEGSFEILSLAGSYVPIGQFAISGGMAAILAGSDGQVLTGKVAGALVASRPAQVMLGSFWTDNLPG